MFRRAKLLANAPKQPKPFVEELKEASEAAEDFIRERELAKAAVVAVPPNLEGAEGTTKGGETSGATKDLEDDPKKPKVRTVPHMVGPDDTYKKLALRYHTTAKVIKKWNNIKNFSVNSLCGRMLEIPVGVTYVEQSQKPTDPKVQMQVLAKAFSRDAPGVEYARIEYYLKNNDLDLKTALNQWREDDAWEQQQTALGKGPLAEKLKLDKAMAAWLAK